MVVDMTENEKLECAIHCMKAQAGIEVCEECNAFLMDSSTCEDVAREGYKALEEVQEYRKLGTVEEVREAVEKTKPKRCIEDTCPDHKHYKCPTCGKIQMSEYKQGRHILGRITNNCENCGQKLEREE